jgi:hypothetical protein
VSLVLHGLVLTGLVIGIKGLAPTPEERAIELRLIPAFEPQPQPRPETAHQSPRAPNALQPLRPHLTPQPLSEVPTLALPETAAPAPVPSQGLGPRGLLPSLSGRLGCDLQDRRLTPEQRQVCANNLVRLAREARPLGPNIPDNKKAGYDRYVRCSQDYRRAGVPLMDPAASGNFGDGVPPSNVDPYYDMGAGLGNAPNQCLDGGG